MAKVASAVRPGNLPFFTTAMDVATDTVPALDCTSEFFMMPDLASDDTEFKPHFDGEPSKSRRRRTQSSEIVQDIAIVPRRKAGQVTKGEKGPVLLTKALLEEFFGMPLSTASKQLGICATAIKKVCRKLGISKWPFRDRFLNSKGTAAAQTNEAWRGEETPMEADDSVDSLSESATSTKTSASPVNVVSPASPPRARRVPIPAKNATPLAVRKHRPCNLAAQHQQKAVTLSAEAAAAAAAAASAAVADSCTAGLWSCPDDCSSDDRYQSDSTTEFAELPEFSEFSDISEFLCSGSENDLADSDWVTRGDAATAAASLTAEAVNVGSIPGAALGLPVTDAIVARAEPAAAYRSASDKLLNSDSSPFSSQSQAAAAAAAAAAAVAAEWMVDACLVADGPAAAS